jgi:hypothetical protein
MIDANGGMQSATADITTAATSEYRHTTAHDSTNSRRQTPISTKYARFRVLSRSGRCGEFGGPGSGAIAVTPYLPRCQVYLTPHLCISL